MRTITQILVIAVLAYVSQLFLPWWSVAVVAALVGFLLTSRFNFLAGFVGVGLLWLLIALRMDMASSSHLADKVAMLFQMNKTSLIAVTCFIGALAGGLGAMTGAALRMSSRKTDAYYKA